MRLFIFYFFTFLLLLFFLFAWIWIYLIMHFKYRLNHHSPPSNLIWSDAAACRRSKQASKQRKKSISDCNYQNQLKHCDSWTVYVCVCEKRDSQIINMRRKITIVARIVCGQALCVCVHSFARSPARPSVCMHACIDGVLTPAFKPLLIFCHLRQEYLPGDDILFIDN